MSIEAPYNFVPLNKEVFYPEWDRQVSHDIPFSDGESGKIKIHIKAESPLFIRNHSDNKDKPSKEFCHIINADGAKEYYIPATSMKGMIHNIVEIMGFAKIRLDEERHKEPLSVRDMTPKQYCEDSSVRRMKDCPQQQKIDLYSSPVVATAQKCGFLVKKNGVYKLEDCGKVVVINHQELKNSFNINVKFMQKASEKYNMYSNRAIEVDTFAVKQQTKAKKGSKKKAEIIFTGDITNKKHEFVFITNGKILDVGDEIVKSFKSVYIQDIDSDLGQYWKNKSKIPVFYTTNAKGKLKAIGLTQIFKLAYNKTLLEAAKQETKKDRYDLAETLFGYVDGTRALKGRVVFSHFKSTTVSFGKNTEQVLGSPNPTYYPNYIEQEDLNGIKLKRYTTLMDDATIRGYKRYPLQDTIQSYPLPKNDKGEVNHDVATKFHPLDTGTTFEGFLHFHNLKKAEIGALLSALTFHNQGKNYMHNIGMAKSLGYGKISITLEKFTYSERLKKENQTEYIESFEEMMNSWSEKTYTTWKESTQIQNLLAMHNNSNAKSLEYQSLKNSKTGKNDFILAKQKREYLEPYVRSQIIKVLKKTPVVEEKVVCVKPDGISKTKMRVTLRESWLRVFKIPYNIHDVKYFNQQKSEFIEDAQAKNVYQKIKDYRNMQHICKYIELFFANAVEPEDQIALYKAVQKLK